MAKKSSEGRTASPASLVDPISRTATPIDKSVGVRVQDSTSRTSTERAAVEDPGNTNSGVRDAQSVNQETPVDVPDSLEKHAKTPILSQATTPVRTSMDDESRSHTPDIIVNGIKIPHEAALGEEAHAYIEKIDALQAKLQYLTREAAASAHDAATAAKAGSLEKKLFEKDEKIALLMEEGEKLSKSEMKHLMIIRKLRSQAAEIAKSQTNIKARAEKAEASLSNAEERASRAEAAMRRAEENLEASLNANRDVEALRNERDALTTTVAEIKAQLAHATKRADNAETRAQSEALDRKKKQVLDLHDELTSLKVDREISEEKLRCEIRELKASLEREKDHSMSLQAELRAEQSLLESKMESLRNRAEEASSSNVSESQAKLLRQIETLQNQYAVASENWQGIESSLLTRIANVEKERDGLEHNEGEMRKKFRQAMQKAKNAEKESEATKDALHQSEQSFCEQKSEVQRLRSKLKETEDSLANARRNLEEQKQRFETDLSRRIDEEKNKWKEHILLQSPTAPRNGSPISSMRKSAGLGLGLEHMTGSFVADRIHSHRSSVLPHSARNSSTPPQQNSSNSFQTSTSGTAPDTPASQAIEQDEYFPDSPTPASLDTYRGVNDLISVSTVAAGPSVQLVERMSASVRRLESEKAAAKDELARLTAQRDESRREVVALMREVDQKRASDKRIKALEEELRLMNDRHQTTLEMLGEKSELVEELKADIADVKQMYRDLVDTTMK